MSAPPTAATAHAAFRARKYFGEIDGLRAFAIAAVAWNHSGHGPDNFGHGLGVVLFFVLSGFLITTLLLREESKTGTISLTGFYARRSLRIFPLYFSVLALYVVLVLVVEKGSPEGRQFFSNLPYYLTFTANYFVTWEEGKRTIFYFAWSLSAQEQFYTIWPVVVRYLRPWWAPVAVMVGTLVATEAVGRAAGYGLLDPENLLVRIVTGFPVAIGLGFLSAYLLHREAAFRLAWPLLRWRWAAPVGLAALVAEAFFPETPRLVSAAGAVLLVVAFAVRPDNPLAVVVDRRPLRYVGTISLGIYLLHLLALNVVQRLRPGAPRWQVFVLGFPLAVAAAAVSFKYFESPFIQLKGRFGGARPAPAAAAVAPGRPP